MTRMNKAIWRSSAAVATMVLVAGALAVSQAADALQNAQASFASLVTRGDGGSHILGNPAARLSLVEYVSYTCSHCATFSAQSSADLRARFIAGGGTRVEVRHIVRDPIDMAMAVAANCGAPGRFFSRHEALMAQQTAILGQVQALPPATVQAWTAGPVEGRLRRISDGSGVTAWMQARGFTATQINQCMADQTMQQRIFAMTQAGTAAGVTHTPSFAINGRLLPATEASNWATLAAALTAAALP